jgi:hypothetical protein
MRSLAKKPEDRFEQARDMRKMLEAALRDGDVGLVETQRLNREILGDPAPSTSFTPSRATPLADELEPGLTGSAPAARPKRARLWPWIALAIAVLAAGGVAAAIVLTTGSKGYEPQFAIKGVTLSQGKRFEDLHLFVETDGKVTPDEVVAAYRDQLAKARSFQPRIAESLDVIDEIVAIPPKALCEPSAYPAHLPEDCASALEERTYGKGAARVLLVVDDKVSLALSLRSGVAHAVCDFQAAGVPPEAQLKTCDLANRFAGSK